MLFRSVSQSRYVSRTYSSDPFVYNATYAGDGVEDTYASPSEYLDEDVDASGVYVGLQRDCSGVFLGTDGVLYKTYQVPIKNFMNVKSLENIRFQGDFTVGQGLRMRVLIDSGSLDSVLLLTETTVASLYEPFETSFVAGMYVISTNDLGNGYAEVLNAGTSYSGNIRWIQVVNDAVLSSVASASGNVLNPTRLQSITLPAGLGIGGRFSSVAVTSGVVIAYFE